MMAHDDRLSVLIVDDEAEVRSSLAELLGGGYHVLVAANAEDGLRMLDAYDVQIAFTDQRLPGMTGVEFLKIVKRRWAGIVRVLFTGYGDLDVVRRAVNEGSVFRYLNKPLDPHDVQSALREAGDYWRLAQERERLLEQIREQTRRKSALIDLLLRRVRLPLESARQSLAGLRPDDPAQDLCLQDASRGLYQISECLDQVVLLLQAEGMERPPTWEPVDVRTCVRETCEQMRSFATVRSQEIDVRVGEDAPAVSGDGRMLRDLVRVLLRSALSVSPDGSRVGLTLRRRGDGWAEIEVVDAGPPLQLEAPRGLMDPLGRGRGEDGERYGRPVGLELAVAARYAQVHGGRMALEPAQHGACVRVLLPPAG